MRDKKSIIDPEDIRVLLKILRKNWYLLLGIPLFAYLIGVVYTYRLTDVYGAKTEILLKNNETYDYQSKMYQGLGYYGMYSDVTNQKRILTSYDLVSQTLDKLNFEISYYIVGRLKTREMFGGVPFNISIKLIKPKLAGQLFDIKILSNEEYWLSYDYGGSIISKTYKFDEEVLTKHFEIQVVKGRHFSDKRLKELKEVPYQFRVNTRPFLVNRYRNYINILNPDYTTILEVSVEDEIAQRAKMFLDTLSMVFLNHSLNAEYKINENTLIYIDKQLKEVEYVLDSLEDELENYKRDKTILDLDKEKTIYFNKLVNYDSDKRQLELSLESIASLRKYLVNLNDERLLPPSFYVLEADKFLETILRELYEMQMEYNDLTISSKEENFNIKRVEENLRMTKENILTYLKNTEVAIKDNIREIQKQLGSYEAIIKRIPKSQRDILDIERRRKVNEDLYLFLLEKRSNTNIARAGLIPQFKIISSARSIGIVRPNRKKMLLLALAIGFVISATISILRFVLFDRIESLDELKAITKISVLGAIPFKKENFESELINGTSFKSQMDEAFRNSWANLEFLAAENKKVVLMSSVHPGEGKTFTSSYFANLVSRTGRKTLLIDFDLHKPKLHRRFNIENTKGVSSFLVGKSDFESILVQHPNIEDLYIIPSGAIPPNPSELLGSNNTSKLIELARENFEFVFIDTPPMGLLSDGYSLLKLVDVGVFVMNTRVANKRGVAFVEELTERSGVKSKGILLNGVKVNKWSYLVGKYAYKYGYGYGYGYSYTYGQSYSENVKEN